MPDLSKLEKAKLCEIDADFDKEINEDKCTTVQFNPDTLKVSFANQLVTPPGSGDQSGPQALQFVGAGTITLSVQLYFDITSEFPQGLPEVNDVRKLTARVAYFITARPQLKNKQKLYIAPAVRFLWGSFRFDGVMQSLDETLELFSPEGRPLRATVAMSLIRKEITEFKFNKVNSPPSVTMRGGNAPGTSPLTEAPAGSSLQSLAANQSGLGVGLAWQSIAAANGIENPRLLKPGQLVDLNPPSVPIG
jgi:hypothetical protein